jgi:tRNA A-37 threonylcarbamoyl transferase component Bud32
MHGRGIYHADLKSNNILVADRGPDQWSFWFVDLDRVRFQKSLSFSQRANNLAQINASVAEVMSLRDRLKFFRFYAKGTEFFSARKKYYKRILAIGRTKNTEPYGIRFSRTD